MKWQDHIISDKDVLLGKPTIKGTRLAVDHLVSLLAQGWTERDILDNYPRLTKEDLMAVFAYLYDCMQDGLFVNTTKRTA